MTKPTYTDSQDPDLIDPRPTNHALVVGSFDYMAGEPLVTLEMSTPDSREIAIMTPRTALDLAYQLRSAAGVYLDEQEFDWMEDSDGRYSGGRRWEEDRASDRTGSHPF